MPKSDLPFGSEFSPEVIDLRTLLGMVCQHNGNRPALEEDIRVRFFGRRPAGAQQDLAKNPILAMAQYGLIVSSKDVRPTDLARQLVATSDDQALYEAFARHILLNRHGRELVETVLAMQEGGEPVNLVSLAGRLREIGLYVPPSGTHISRMKAWLTMAGVFEPGESYAVNQATFTRLLGASSEEMGALAGLTTGQRQYLRALCNLPDPDPLNASSVAAYAEALYKIRFNPKALPLQVLMPLERLGYVRLEKTTGGRGAKPFLLHRTDRFRREVLLPLLESIEQEGGLSYRSLLQKPLAVILDEMSAGDKHIKGKGLEALAIHLMRLLDLRLKHWRLRARDTGGAEVDVIVEGARLVFTRWQIQCKNSVRATLDDVAKEVGLSLRLRSNVILIVTSGRVGRDARRFADFIVEGTNLNLALVDGRDLRRIANEPTAIVEVLSREAEHAMDVKKLEV